MGGDCAPAEANPSTRRVSRVSRVRVLCDQNLAQTKTGVSRTLHRNVHLRPTRPGQHPHLCDHDPGRDERDAQVQAALGFRPAEFVLDLAQDQREERVVEVCERQAHRRQDKGPGG